MCFPHKSKRFIVTWPGHVDSIQRHRQSKHGLCSIREQKAHIPCAGGRGILRVSEAPLFWASHLWHKCATLFCLHTEPEPLYRAEHRRGSEWLCPIDEQHRYEILRYQDTEILRYSPHSQIQRINFDSQISRSLWPDVCECFWGCEWGRDFHSTGTFERKLQGKGYESGKLIHAPRNVALNYSQFPFKVPYFPPEKPNQSKKVKNQNRKTNKMVLRKKSRLPIKRI